MPSPKRPKRHTVDDLCRAAADACHCDHRLILTPNRAPGERTAAPSLARHFVYYYLIRDLGLTQADAGRVMAERHHSTISYGLERMDGYLSTNERAVKAKWQRFQALTAGWNAEGWDFPALRGQLAAREVSA